MTEGKAWKGLSLSCKCIMFACKRIVEQATRKRLDTFYIMQQFCENCCIMKQLQAKSRCVWGAAVCGVHENSTLFKTSL